MEKWKAITGKVMFLVIILVVLVLVYDAVAISKGGTEASISSIVINMTYTMPFATHITVFLCGVLFGHLFWRMKPNKDTIKNNIDKI
jgi:hypothetical protein